MILSSTVRKLAATGATIYRVEVPAHTVRLGGHSIDHERRVEFFATKAQAHKLTSELSTWAVMTSAPMPTVTAVTCTMADHYMLT